MASGEHTERSDRPRLHVSPDQVEGEGPVRLEIAVSDLPPGSIRLVVDLYDGSHPVHPEGHLGYWSRPAGAAERASLTLDLDRDFGHAATLSPEPFQWSEKVTPVDLGAIELVEVHVVLFDADRGENLWDAVVPWFRSERSRARRQERLRELLEAPPHVRALAAPGLTLAPGARVHVVAPDVRGNDAVGNLAIDLARWLRLHGIESQLWARNFDPFASGAIRGVERLTDEANPDDLVFYQLSIGDPLLDEVLALPGPKVAFYQGITPPSLLVRFEPGAAAACTRGIETLPRLAGFDALLAGSEFTAGELRAALGESVPAGGIRICPPTLNLDRFRYADAEPVTLPCARRFLLYVGRTVPHKRLEDLLDALVAYRRFDPECDLVLAGALGGDVYEAFLRERIASLPGGIAEHVHRVEDPSDGALKTLYQGCRAFVIASEHEGFCLPVVEAMAFRKPVLAHAVPAVQEALGGAGVFTVEKNPEKVAAAWHAALSNGRAEQALLAVQDARLEVLRRAANGSCLAESLRQALEAHR